MRYFPIFPIIVLICFLSLPNFSSAQHAVSLNLSGATAVEASNNDFGSQMGIEYQYKFADVKDKLFFYALADGFYQPKAWKGNSVSVSDAPQFEVYRYGGTLQTGIRIKGSIINTELGIGLSRHVVNLKQTSFGFTSPDFTPDYSLPRYSKRHYITLDFVFSLSHDFNNSIFMKTSFEIQSALNENPDANYLRPGIGSGYNF